MTTATAIPTAREVVEQQSCNRSKCECHAARRKGAGLTHCPAHDDPGPSLSVKQDGERVLLHCFAGCTWPAIEAALGVASRPTFTAPVKARAYSGGSIDCGPVVAQYVYSDRAGVLPLRKNRHEPKSFTWESLDSAGRWERCRKGQAPGLYYQDAVTGAAAGAVVFFAGGEKGADRLRELGELATCCPDGDASWDTAFAESFRGKVVISLPDNDAAGHQLAQRLVADLSGIAKHVYVVRLPGLEEHQDVYDYLARGGTVEQIVRLAMCDGPATAAPADSGRIVELEAERDELRRRLRAISTVQSNEVLNPGARCTTIALAKHLDAAAWDGQQRGDGVIHVSLTQLARTAGVSRQAASGHIKLLATGGMIARTVKRVPKPDGPGFTSELLIRPLAGKGVVGLLEAVGSFKPAEAPKRGGWRARRCPNGCDAELVPSELVCPECGEPFAADDPRIQPQKVKSHFGTSHAAAHTPPLRSLRESNRLSELRHAGADSLKHQNGTSEKEAPSGPGVEEQTSYCPECRTLGRRTLVWHKDGKRGRCSMCDPVEKPAEYAGAAAGGGA